MAVRRGVVVVIFLIFVAVAVSAAGLVFTALLVGRAPRIDRNSTLVLRVSGDLPGDGAGRRHRAVLRGAADGPLARRGAAQGEGRSPHHQRDHRADRRRRRCGARCRRSATRSSTSSARGKPIVAYLEYGGEQEFYLATRVRQGLPDADRVARPDRHGQLRAVPARHARQDRRLSRRAAHRRLQDRVEHVHRAHLHAGAPRDGGVAQHRSLRAAGARPRRRPAQVRERRFETLIDHGPFLPEDALRAGLSTTWPTRTSSTTRSSSRDGRRSATSSSMTDYRQVSAASPRSRTAARGSRSSTPSGLIASGRSNYDSPRRTGRRLRHDRRVPAQGARRQLDQGDRAAHRQPGRIGDRVGRHLARGAADQEREAADRVDVRRGGVGRLLHRDAGARDRRRAGDADRLDWRRA